ncbi:MAG: peptide chain release factor N(5)-glutamine methyltransferase [Ilumatobacter sp.]|uniref:peptide chain release factor N(5)-glutamine methyltransferase n=1 Tax=Ilumatobacter sp. TaxID=1967498 RepID=UPI00391B1206
MTDETPDEIPDEISDDGGSTISWRELLRETEALVGEPRHARWICETATSSTPTEFLSMLESPATERAVAHLDAMVTRARQGEPVQYVLGSWGFRRLDLVVDQRVLIPRPETELLVELALTRARRVEPTRTLVDLGTGSGAIGLALADELPLDGTTVWITDASLDALDVARANLAGIGRSATNVRVAHGSWFDALPADLLADVIVSNPPYVAVGTPELDPSVADWEPTSALLAGTDGLDEIRTIVTGAPHHLVASGWLLVEHGHDQGDAVRALFGDANLSDVATHRDLAGHERVTLGRRPR